MSQFSEEETLHSYKSWWHGIHSFCLNISGLPALKNGTLRTATLFFIIIFASAFIITLWMAFSFSGFSLQMAFSTSRNENSDKTSYVLNCFPTNRTKLRCPPKTIPETTIHSKFKVNSTRACPEYFRWIHEDLRPWKETGISKEMVEAGDKSGAHIRLVVVNGTAYMVKYRSVFQTRDVFTVWGILQLLRLYPGMLPDLDLMFGCNDKPLIRKSDYKGDNATAPPPVFHYCGNDLNFDVVFPDWTFWGWPEVNINPWNSLKEELEEGNHRVSWMNRVPYAFWKGNPRVSPLRHELMKCNITDEHDWNARLYNLSWKVESQNGFKQTNLASQCTHRFKIYIEGVAWSVSEKYILACDSMSLVITPHYYDFFTRSLLPMVHYWPINEKSMCKSIKFAVDWGNRYPRKAQEIGKAGSKFIQEELMMNHVYDYMFHLLNEYGKLMRYKPTVPPGAVELCTETMVCGAKGAKRRFKMQSMVNHPSDTSPCTLPPPYDDPSFRTFLERKANLIKQVEILEANGTARVDSKSS